jgi:hypothetical protein
MPVTFNSGNLTQMTLPNLIFNNRHRAEHAIQLPQQFEELKRSGQIILNVIFTQLLMHACMHALHTRHLPVLSSGNIYNAKTYLT